MKKPWRLRDRGGICCAKNKEAAAQATAWPGVGRDNAGLNAARLAQHPLADRCRDLTKQIDLAAKLAGRVIDIAVKELDARKSEAWDNGDANKARKALEVARADVVEALRLARYFVRQADWHQERFPEAKPRDVEGLVKLVDRATIKAHDWSLTPGRYVGVALEEPNQHGVRKVDPTDRAAVGSVCQLTVYNSSPPRRRIKQ